MVLNLGVMDSQGVRRKILGSTDQQMNLFYLGKEGFTTIWCFIFNRGPQQEEKGFTAVLGPERGLQPKRLRNTDTDLSVV